LGPKEKNKFARKKLSNVIERSEVEVEDTAAKE